jgi:membrane-associated protease RseP (regulator of RpoE activity)
MYREPGYLGIGNVYQARSFNEGMQQNQASANFILGLFQFLFIINFGVGLANLLPIKPLDGGRMWDIVFRKYIPRHAAALTKGLGIITFIIIVANFVLPYV